MRRRDGGARSSAAAEAADPKQTRQNYPLVVRKQTPAHVLRKVVVCTPLVAYVRGNYLSRADQSRIFSAKSSSPDNLVAHNLGKVLKSSADH